MVGKHDHKPNSTWRYCTNCEKIQKFYYNVEESHSYCRSCKKYGYSGFVIDCEGMLVKNSFNYPEELIRVISEAYKYGWIGRRDRPKQSVTLMNTLVVHRENDNAGTLDWLCNRIKSWN